MRQRRMYSLSQSYSYTPSKGMLQRTPTAITARRATRVVSFVFGFALGTGISLLLILLSTWLFPSTPTPTTSVISNDQAQVWTPSHSEAEKLGLASVLIEEPFARL
jgi:hypothetical protein